MFASTWTQFHALELEGLLNSKDSGSRITCLAMKAGLAPTQASLVTGVAQLPACLDTRSLRGTLCGWGFQHGGPLGGWLSQPGPPLLSPVLPRASAF